MADLNAWAIIVPGIVTPAVVAGFAYYQQHKERQSAERHDVRVILDLAAARLTAYHSVAHGLFTTWRDGGPVQIPTPESVNANTAAYESVTQLTIRLGRMHEVTKAYQRAFTADTELVNHVRGRAELGESYPASDHDPVDHKLREANGTRDLFLDAATKLVGYEPYQAE